MKNVLFLLATLAVASFATNALNFDGVDDNVQTSIPPDQIGSSFTVEAWINASGLVDGAIVSNLSTVKSSYYTISGFELHVGTDGALVFTVRSSNDSWIDFKTPSGLILTYDWIHVTATFDGTAVTMYINGEPQTVTGVMAGNFVPGTASLKIGRRVTGDEQTFSFYGNIAEVQLWNTVRTPSEILLDMKGYDSKQTTQIAYYKLDQGTAEGSNSQEYTANCLVNPDNNGILTNFTLNGTSSNWVSGYNPDQFGVAPSGIGSNADPYQIDSLPNLRWLSSNKRAWSAGVESKLMRNIDATDTKNWDDGKGFSPIGNGMKGFEGVFHGNGKVITGLTINRPSSYSLGFFGDIWSNAKIDSLGLVNASVIGRTYSGSFFGSNQGNITNCFVKTSSVTSADSVTLTIGLFGGDNQGSISTSFATGSTVATALKENVFSIVSGFVALNRGTIFNSYSMGSVKSTSINANADAGGLVGENYGSIRHCFSTDTLLATSTSNYAIGGGIVAVNQTGSLVSNSYSTGPIHANGNTNAIGGIAGLTFAGTIDSSYSSAKFSVNSSVDYLGGVVGYFNGGSVNGCFWDIQTTGATKPTGTGSNVTSIGLSTEAMMSAASFSGLDLDNIWTIYEGHSYPLLRDFLTTLQVTANPKVSKDYNKKPIAFADLVTYNLPSVDASLLLGSLGKADTAKNVGTYSIDPSQLYSSQLGYLITPVGIGSLTISPKTISVTAIADTITVGASEPALEYKADALIAGDAFTGKLTRKSGTSAGKYPIQIGTLTAGSNYTINFTSADFVIKAKPVFINPDIPQLPFTGQVSARIFNLQGMQVWTGLLDVTDGRVSMPNLGAGHWTVKMRMGNTEKVISTTLR